MNILKQRKGREAAMKKMMKALGFTAVALAEFALLAALIIVRDIPGGKRFRRYCSYSDMKALMVAEEDDITATLDYDRDGTNYTLVVLKPCRYLASGPAFLVYGPDGNLFDRTGDEGDDGRFQREWPRPWNWRHAETVRRLKAITMPEVYFYAPATMKDFVEYMGRATKDFDSQDIPLENRGITFVCADSVAAKTGPEKPKQETALIPCGGIGATTTAWDALTNVCNSVGFRFKVYSGKVEIGK